MNDKGQVFEKISKKPDGTIYERIVYTLNEIGECDEWFLADGNGTVRRTFKIQMNKDGEKTVTESDKINKTSNSYPLPY